MKHERGTSSVRDFFDLLTKKVGGIDMKINQVSIKKIQMYDKNPRINDTAVDKVAASIKEFGFKQPIVVDRDGVIIAGHTRHSVIKCKLFFG